MDEIRYVEPMMSHAGHPDCVCATEQIAECLDVADSCYGERSVAALAAVLCAAEVTR